VIVDISVYISVNIHIEESFSLYVGVFACVSGDCLLMYLIVCVEEFYCVYVDKESSQSRFHRN